MRARRRPAPNLAAIGALAALVLAAAPAAGAPGFFDDLPRRGYILEDYAYLVNRAGAGVAREKVATIRFVRLALDPGIRGVAQDLWPEREMLLVEHASGELVAFERIVRPSPPRSPDDPVPMGRVGLEGSALEVFFRGAVAVLVGRPAACGGEFRVLASGGRDLPVAPEDLGAATVREGISLFVDARVAERDRDLITRTVQIALRAGQSKALPLSSLDVLKTLFPGRRFDPWPEALVFDVSPDQAIDPGAGAWRSVTDAPEMLAGAPLF